VLLRHASFRNLCHARELLSEYSENQRSVKSIAQEIAVSPFHFIRQFEAIFGVTPHQFRIQNRLEEAKLLLAKGEYSVTEVCMEVGFSSLGSFSDLFTRRVGSSPRAYQRQARSLVQVPNNYPQVLFPGCLSLMAFLPSSAFRNFREARSAPPR
jgi:AraC-like DNA-binding protein